METNNFKPFDLEQALAGKPVVDRAGRPVTQITRFEGVNNGLCVVGVDGVGDLNHYHHDGLFLWSKKEGILDLFMAPVEKTVWVNHYRDLIGLSGVISFTYASEEDAARAATMRSNFLGRTTFTYTV